MERRQEAGIPTLREGDELTLAIGDLAFGGRGVGRTAGRVVFVHGALQGETVRARITAVRRQHAEARTLSVLHPSPDRRTPPCAHYGRCGGCSLQHLEPGAQARAKETQVRALIARVGKLPGAAVRPIIGTPEPWRYSSRMDFDWSQDSGGRPVIGLHRAGRGDEVVAVQDCHLLSDNGNQILQWMVGQAVRRRLSVWDGRRRRGLLRRLSLQEARGTGEILVTLETGRGDPPLLASLGSDLQRFAPRVVGVVRREFSRDGTAAGVSLIAGRDYLVEQIEEDRFRIPCGAFFQPHGAGSALLRRTVLEALAPRPGWRVLELFAGVGFLTVALGRQGVSVTAVEGRREAAAAARHNLRAAGVERCDVVCGEVTEVLPEILRQGPFDGLLLDPPRGGLRPAAVRALSGGAARRVVYVSCDPATLARDLGRLTTEGGFGLESVIPLDLFPQTGHVECVAILAGIA